MNQRVVYKRITPGGTTVESVHSVTALNRDEPTTYVPIGKGGKVSPRRCRWHIKANDLPFTPRANDLIVTDTDGTWQVEDCTAATLRTRYLVNCIQVSS